MLLQILKINLLLLQQQSASQKDGAESDAAKVQKNTEETEAGVDALHQGDLLLEGDDVGLSEDHAGILGVVCSCSGLKRNDGMCHSRYLLRLSAL